MAGCSVIQGYESERCVLEGGGGCSRCRARSRRLHFYVLDTHLSSGDVICHGGSPSPRNLLGYAADCH